MTFTSSYRFVPGQTSSVIKMIIIITCCVSVFSALTNGIFNHFHLSGFQYWLSLSWYGVVQFYVWQPITYLFVQYSGFQGISFYYLFTLFLNMYILWILGSIVAERLGTGPFLRLYFFSGIFAGLFALLMMPIAGYTILAGITPSLLALLMVWTLFNPEAEILLFFLIPVKIKWLTAGILGATALFTFSELDFVRFVFYLFGALYGYLYALLVWNLKGPFPILHPVEHAVARVGIFFRRHWKKKEGKEDKIVQFPDSQMDDDKFVDAMLTKISRHGESALSWGERRRMDEISRKRANKRF